MRLPVLVSLVLTVGCNTPPPDDRTAPVAVLDSVCTGTPITHGHGQILREWVRPGTRPSCVSASTCDAYLACQGVDPSRTCAFPDGVRCDGNVQQTCTPTGALRRRACDGANPVCTVDEHGSPDCSTGVACEGRGARCLDEGQMERCIGGHLVRWTCIEGMVCVDVEGGAVCADQAAPCEASRCDGTRLERCVGGGAITLRECADLPGGGTCEEVDGGARCVPTETVCETGELRCEGAVARVCTDGVWVDFDCGAFDAACVEMEDGLRCVG